VSLCQWHTYQKSASKTSSTKPVPDRLTCNLLTDFSGISSWQQCCTSILCQSSSLVLVLSADFWYVCHLHYTVSVSTDCDYVIEDDDHVTSVTSFPIDGGADFLLLYGTVSGCVFGMSVNHRSKVFSIPCPHVDVSTSAAVDAVTFLPSGQLLVGYRGWTGFTVLNFGVVDPPNRPPTRCLKRDT